MRSAIILIAALVFAFCAVQAYASLAWTVHGDWGVKNTWSDKMARVSQKHKSRFITAIGDNFYKEHGANPTRMGITSVNDPKWKRVFENVYKHKFFDNRWYVVAGNHDYNGNEQAQIDYTKTSKRWYFPSFYYNFTKKSGSVTVEFFMLNTVPFYYSVKELEHVFHIKTGKDTKQINWLADRLSKSTATWKIVMGHHQVYTAHGGNAYMIQHIEPLLKKHNVAAYINGHIHNVQHVRTKALDFITIGNGAFQQPASGGHGKGRTTLFTYPTPAQYHSKTCSGGKCIGFGVCKIKDKKTMTVYYYNRAGHLVKSINVHNRK